MVLYQLEHDLVPRQFLQCRICRDASYSISQELFYLKKRFFTEFQVELEKIDFNALKKEIELRHYSLYALYTFIRNSQVLDKINEALMFGFSSLKNHLLLMVNLYLDDLQKGA